MRLTTSTDISYIGKLLIIVVDHGYFVKIEFIRLHHQFIDSFVLTCSNSNIRIKNASTASLHATEHMITKSQSLLLGQTIMRKHNSNGKNFKKVKYSKQTCKY